MLTTGDRFQPSRWSAVFTSVNIALADLLGSRLSRSSVEAAPTPNRDSGRYGEGSDFEGAEEDEAEIEGEVSAYSYWGRSGTLNCYRCGQAIPLRGQSCSAPEAICSGCGRTNLQIIGTTRRAEVTRFVTLAIVVALLMFILRACSFV